MTKKNISSRDFFPEHSYGILNYKGKEYHLVFGHPNTMLKDRNISWEAKGYLSAIATLSDDIEFSIPVLDELLYFGYLVEVE